MFNFLVWWVGLSLIGYVAYEFISGVIGCFKNDESDFDDMPDPSYYDDL